MPQRTRPVVDDLLEAAAQGDRPCFDTLYDLLFAAVWSAARRSAVGDAAESATVAALRSAVELGLQRRALVVPADAALQGETRSMRDA